MVKTTIASTVTSRYDFGSGTPCTRLCAREDVFNVCARIIRSRGSRRLVILACTIGLHLLEPQRNSNQTYPVSGIIYSQTRRSSRLPSPLQSPISSLPKVPRVLNVPSVPSVPKYTFCNSLWLGQSGKVEVLFALGENGKDKKYGIVALWKEILLTFFRIKNGLFV